MNHGQIKLIFSRSFSPFFIAQFLGAFNDNVVKNALVVLITFSAIPEINSNSSVLIAIASGLFILPFFLASATAGKVGDKYLKSQMVKHLKLSELIIMLPAVIGFYTGEIWLLMFTLFLLGMQAAFFGPVKYGILRELVSDDDLVAATGMVSAGTFVAILLGTLAGVMLVRTEAGAHLIAALIILAALAGYLASFLIPKTSGEDKTIKLTPNIVSDTFKVIKYTYQNKKVFPCILLISWFWFLGATFLAQMPVFVKQHLNGDEAMVGFFLTLFTVGIGMGSLACNFILRGKIDPRLSIVGTFGISVCIFMLNYVVGTLPAPDTAITCAKIISENQEYLPVFVLTALIPFFGGLHIVPLYSYMQKVSESHHRAQVIASNNILNALMMVLSSVFTIVMAKMGFSINAMFFAVGLTGVVAGIWGFKIFCRKV